jgi:GntR family transcriptional repressor for pyruvate dehydrogenase complex
MAELDRGLSHFRPIRLRKASDVVVAAIVDGIRAGLWEPGDMLPRERDLASKLEVSRTTLREATALLARNGVLAVKRGNGGGFAVMTRSVPSSLMTEMEVVGPLQVRSLLEVRRLVETPAAVLAGRAASAWQLDELERLVEGLRELLDAPEEFIEFDFQFHLRVAEYSGNELMHEFLQEILRQYSTIRTQYPVGHVDLELGIHNQRTTLEAIRSGSVPVILDAVDDHLGSVEEHFLGERLARWDVAA